MATVSDYLGSARDWHEAHCQRIVDALFADDEPRARAELAACWTELRADAQMAADVRRCLEYSLLEYELSITNAFNEGGPVAAQFAETYAAITALPPAGPQSDVVQAKTLIGLVGMGTRRGFVDCTALQMEALLARMPEDTLTPNVWFYIAAWAFHHNDLKHLELAMSYQTVSTTGWLDDYYWLRTNLMYLLVDGRATELDVSKTLQGYSHPLHIREFRRLLLGRCEAAGLMSAQNHALLDRREAELEQLAGTIPPVTPTTVRIVKPD